MTALMFDVRAALRALAAARGFTAVAVLILATGLALAIAVFTAVNAYLLRGLPYPHAERLYNVVYAPPGQSTPSGLEEADWSRLDDLVEHRIAWDLDVFYTLGGSFPESLPGTWVTPGYVHGFDVRAALGRVFDAGDFAPGGPNVALISHRVWQTRFGGDLAVLGRTFNAYVSDRPEEAETFTVIGVLPADFWHLNTYTDVMAPLRAPSYPYMLRLREGVPPALAAERVSAIVRTVASGAGRADVTLTSTHDSYTAAVRPMLWAAGATAVLVLLIAGADVAVLMLVRGRRRQREFGVRLALGASHLQITRLLAVEGLLVGTAAAIAALAVSTTVVEQLGPALERVLGRRIPGGADALALPPVATLGVVAAGVFISMAFTVLPLLASRRTALTPAFALSRRGASEPQGAGRFRDLLIAFEVAASLTLLVGAALMIETAVRMLRVDFGIDAAQVETATIALRQGTFPDDASRAAFADRLVPRLVSATDSRSAALADTWPLQASRPRRVRADGERAVEYPTSLSAVSPNYFATLGMTLRAGRDFAAGDRQGAESVAIVSETLAARLWPNEVAVGARLWVLPEDAGPPVATTIVGVVSDTRQSHTDVELADLYVPFAQRPSRFGHLYLRQPRAPGWDTSLRAAVAAVHPEVAVGTPRRLADGLEQERLRPRFLAALLGAFAAASLFLSLAGLHGVVAYAVRQRQREIAVRMAVGADVAHVTALFLRQGLRVLTVGLGMGLAGALGLGRVLQSQLYEVRPAELRVLALAAVAFALCALTAIWWPAWRAATADPMRILNEQ